MNVPLPDPEPSETPGSPGILAWVETAVLALGPLLLGLWLSPRDPLFLSSGFPWPVLGPILAGLRYGSLHGLCCGLLVDLSLFLLVRAGQAPVMPLAAAAGFPLCGAVCGEFCDQLTRRAGAASTRALWAGARLEAFSRAFHALRASHEKLERHALGARSLREALLAVRGILTHEPGADGLGKAGDRILALLAEHAAVRAASLHPISRDGHMLPAVSTLGGSPAAPFEDSLAREALSKGKLAALYEDPQAAPGQLLAALPLADIAGRVYALVAIRDLHFLAFNDEALGLLAVIGGHLGDLIAASGGGGDESTRAVFERKLRRAVEDARRFKLPSTLVSISPPAAAAEALAGRILEERRGLDPALRLHDAEGRPLLVVLLQLTDAPGADGYLARLERLIGSPLREAGQTRVQLLSGSERIDDLLPLHPQAGPDAPLVALPARR